MRLLTREENKEDIEEIEEIDWSVTNEEVYIISSILHFFDDCNERMSEKILWKGLAL